MKQRQIYIRSGNSRILLITDNAAIDHRSYILKKAGEGFHCAAGRSSMAAR